MKRRDMIRAERMVDKLSAVDRMFEDMIELLSDACIIWQERSDYSGVAPQDQNLVDAVGALKIIQRSVQVDLSDWMDEL